jgi:hypothetical protein
MFTFLLGSFAAAFIVTGMINQMFADGRFPLHTILLVVFASTAGAYAGHLYLGPASIFTSEFIGAAITSTLLFYFFDRTGILAQEPWPNEDGPAPTDEKGKS